VEEQMSTPTGENASLRDLERTVRAELTLAESSVSEQEVLDTPIENWLFDPVDAQRDAVALRSLLAAVETVEGGSHPHGNHVAARDHCLNPSRAVDRPIGEARYGRMFPDLEALDTDPRLLVRAGDAGGICDARPGRCRCRRRLRSRGVAVLRPADRPRHHRRPLAHQRRRRTRDHYAMPVPRSSTWR
jgi:hypothetical protein